MTAADVPDAQVLTASFGWPHRREDWALMQVLGQGVVAERQGRLVGADSRTGASDSQDPVYAARISLDEMQMQVEDKMVDLSPGMAVTVEIKTGSRSVLSYVLSPLRKYRQESLRER